jgi:hypothetical protein
VADDARGPPSRTSSLGSFYAGLTDTTIASFVGMVAFCLLEIALLCVLVTPPRLARLDPRVLMDNPRDDYAKLTIDALRLKYGHDPGLSVVYMGPSTARLGLLHSEAPKLIQDYLTAETGEPVTFHELCSDAQTLEDALVLSDQVPKGFRGIVILVVSDTRDDERNKEIRVHDTQLHAEAREALLSPTDDAYARQQGEVVGGRTGVFFLDNIKFFAIRRATFARIDKSGMRPAIEQQKKPETPREQALWARRMEAGWRFVERDFQKREPLAILNRYKSLLEMLAASWHARGIQGVLLEAPVNPRYDMLKGENAREEYRHEMTEFADKIGVPYWDFADELQLDWRDFADHIHLNDRAARFRYQAAVLRRSALLLRTMSRHVPANAEPLDYSRPPPPKPKAPGPPAGGQITLDGTLDSADGGADAGPREAASATPDAGAASGRPLEAPQH